MKVAQGPAPWRVSVEPRVKTKRIVRGCLMVTEEFLNDLRRFLLC